MFIRRALLAALAVVSFVALDRAEAQNFPDKLIKIVVPYPPGGPSDVAARLVAQPLSTILGQSVIVENIAGAGGRIGGLAAVYATHRYRSATPFPLRSSRVRKIESTRRVAHDVIRARTLICSRIGTLPVGVG